MARGPMQLHRLKAGPGYDVQLLCVGWSGDGRSLDISNVSYFIIFLKELTFQLF